MRTVISTNLVPIPAEAVPRKIARRRLRGVKRGAKAMFLSGVLAPVFLGLSFLADNPGPLLIPLTIFLAGLALVLYTQLFGEGASTVTRQQVQPSSFEPRLTDTALPPASNLGINSFGEQQVRTKELVQPPSITEHTTRLLDND